MKYHRIKTLSAISLISSLFVQIANAQPWSIQSLPTPQFYESILPYAINSSGDVVGQACAPYNHCDYSFLFRDGKTSIIDVERLPVSPWRKYVPSRAIGINDAGDIVGEGGVNAYGSSFYLSQGTLSAIPGLLTGITNSGAITRQGENPIKIENGIVVEVTAYGSDIIVNALSDNGYAIGYKTTDAQFLIISPTGERTELVAPSQDAIWWSATHINNFGLAIGVSKTPDRYQAVVWQNGGATDIGSLGGNQTVANAINDLGQVVGYSNYSGNHSSSAFLSDGTSIVDLLALPGVREAGWTEIINAIAINNKGQITGIGTLDGNRQAFIMSPIPEPSQALLSIAGIMTLIMAIRKSKAHRL